MEMDYSGGLYKISIWIMRFAYLNLLWVTFTFLGIIILGFFPATVAMLTIERKWIKGETEFPIFQTFRKEFKKEFLNSNVLGFFLALFGLLLFVNFKFLALTGGTMANFLSIILLAFSFIYLIILIYIFPVYVHYQGKNMERIKNSFFVGLFSPLMTIMIVLSMFCFYHIIAVFPGIFPVFAGSGAGFAVMWFSYCAFKRIEGKSNTVQ